MGEGRELQGNARKACFTERSLNHNNKIIRGEHIFVALQNDNVGKRSKSHSKSENMVALPSMRIHTYTQVPTTKIIHTHHKYPIEQKGCKWCHDEQ
jgi:hypothetical protein